MNIAHKWVVEPCAQLKLTRVADVLPHLAQKVIADDMSLTQSLKLILKAEQAAQWFRQRTTLTRLSSFPAIQTPDNFDFAAARLA